MREISAPPAPSGATLPGVVWRWLRRPHQVSLTPLGGLAAAAALGSVVVFSGMHSAPRARPAPPQAESRAFQFVLVAPRATHVALVGDFNDWDATGTPMRRTGREALWTAVVPLVPGRYHYAFFVDGSRWLADPSAPVARDEDYGEPSSVRSEEHTSELQSQSNLVCRLLLEKKRQYEATSHPILAAHPNGSPLHSIAGQRSLLDPSVTYARDHTVVAPHRSHPTDQQPLLQIA